MIQRKEIKTKLATHNIKLSRIAEICKCDKSTVTRFLAGSIQRDRFGIVKVSIKLIKREKRKEEVVRAELDEL